MYPERVVPLLDPEIKSKKKKRKKEKKKKKIGQLPDRVSEANPDN